MWMLNTPTQTTNSTIVSGSLDLFGPALEVKRMLYSKARAYTYSRTAEPFLRCSQMCTHAWRTRHGKHRSRLKGHLDPSSRAKCIRMACRGPGEAVSRFCAGSHPDGYGCRCLRARSCCCSIRQRSECVYEREGHESRGFLTEKRDPRPRLVQVWQVTKGMHPSRQANQRQILLRTSEWSIGTI
jgi:hypothetical protein